MVILLSGRTCADIESCANAEPFYFPHEFRIFANLLVSDFATKLLYHNWVNLIPCH